jgi:hypothetical protein
LRETSKCEIGEQNKKKKGGKKGKKESKKGGGRKKKKAKKLGMAEREEMKPTKILLSGELSASVLSPGLTKMTPVA